MPFASRFSIFKRWLWLLNRRRLHRRVLSRRTPYASWCARHDQLDAATLTALRARLAALPEHPWVNVELRPAGGKVGITESADAGGDHSDSTSTSASASASASAITLDSLQAQIYPNWRLVNTDTDGAADADDAAPWHVIATAGQLWRPHALLLLVEAAVRHPQALLVYADHDTLRCDGTREAPAFKCDWNPDLLLPNDCIGAPVLWRAPHLRSTQAAGSRGPHDSMLKGTTGLTEAQVVHVPHVLLHQAAGAPLPDADATAVNQHLQRNGTRGHAVATGTGVRVRFALPEPPPSVSIVIPTRNGLDLLRICIASLRSKTDYTNYEVVIVDNGSDDAACLRYLDELARQPGVRVRRDASPFNYARLNNDAVASCSSEVIVLLNNDIEVVDGDWLREMVSLATLPGVGAVGARLLYADRSVQHAGVILGIGGGAGHGHKRLGEFDGGYLGRALCLQGISAVTAACLAVRRSHYEAIGGLDAAAFAVAFNDIDFCLRLRQRGLRNLYTPHAVLLHHESVSRGSDRDAVRRPRFEAERSTFRARWGPLLDRDPAYSPNLTLDAEHFGWADPPRVTLRQPWMQIATTDPTP